MMTESRRNSSFHVKFTDDAKLPNGNIAGQLDDCSLSQFHCPVSPYHLKLAATYVEDAKLGQHTNLQPSERNLMLYQHYHRPVYSYMLCAVLLCHLSLAVFEEPAVQGCQLPYWVPSLLEVCCLLFYSYRLLMAASFSPWLAFRVDPKNIILSLCIVLIFIDVVVCCGLRSGGVAAVRLTRVLRPVACVCWPEVRSVRVALRTLRRALPAVLHVVLLYFALLATAALMAYKMLGHKELVLVSGRAYFSSYWDSLFDLYVLVTTANHPDIMMPALNEHLVYVAFFVAVLVLCYFIYMNVVLAVVYNSYKRHLKAEVLSTFLGRQEQLVKAFDLLCHPPTDRRSRVVCYGRFHQLVGRLPQSRSPALIAVLFAVLDTDCSLVLERSEFLRLSELLSVEVSEIQVQWSLLRRVSIVLPKFTRALTLAVNSRYFQYFFDALTVLNAVVIGLSSETSWWDAPLEWCFLSCFLAEIVLKLVSLGPIRFFRRSWNTFDFVVIGAAFLIGIAEEIVDGARESRLSLDVLLVLRVLRLVRIVGNSSSLQMIVLTLTKILPSLRTYGAVILIFYYKFAIVGMELFGGLVTGSKHHGNSSTSQFLEFCGNARLNGTDYWQQRYCNNNFNDILHSFILLFELTVVNQWHVLAYGFSAVTHPSARLFFLFFHLVVVTLLLNVFTSFVLEVFLLEYSASEGLMESQLETKIKALGLSETRRRRKSSTISHTEMVMQDSSDDEDGYGRQPQHSAADQTTADTISSDPADVAAVDGRSCPDADDGGRSTTEEDCGSVAPAQYCVSTPPAADTLMDTSVRFHLSKSVRSVEVLLQKLFEHELQKEFAKAENQRQKQETGDAVF